MWPLQRLRPPTGSGIWLASRASPGPDDPANGADLVELVVGDVDVGVLVGVHDGDDVQAALHQPREGPCVATPHPLD